MFDIVRCRGVLHKAMSRNTQQMSIVSFFIFTIPLIIISFSFPDGSTVCKVAGYLLLWYMISLVVLKKVDYEDGNMGKIVTLPVYLSVKLSVIIFKFFLKKKYPEMEEEHYLRWVKLQKLKKQIKTK